MLACRGTLCLSTSTQSSSSASSLAASLEIGSVVARTEGDELAGSDLSSGKYILNQHPSSAVPWQFLLRGKEMVRDLPNSPLICHLVLLHEVTEYHSFQALCLAFLKEHADFANRCIGCFIAWILPPTKKAIVLAQLFP